MARITLRDAAQWCGGTVEEKYADVVFSGAGNDTRSLQPGQLFIALQGARDGHDFIPAAMEKGAAAVLCSRDFREAPGPKGAAEFIETAPHLMPEEDKKQMRKKILPGILQLLFWLIAIPLIILLPKLLHRNLWWLIAIIANILFIPYKNWTMRTGK